MNMQSTRRQQQLDQIMGLFGTMSLGQRVTLGGAALGLVASLFSWYGASVSFGTISYSVSINGWHGWGYLAILGFMAAEALAAFAARGGSVRQLAPGLPPGVTDARVVLGAGIVSALATILFMLTQGSSVSAPGFSAGPAFGAYLGLLCGVAVAAAGYLMERDAASRRG